MKNKIKVLLATGLLALGVQTPMVSQSYKGCSHVSFMYTENGSCIDLSSLTKTGTLINNSLSLKFFNALRSNGVKITNEPCKKSNLNGYYEAKGKERTINLCPSKMNLSSKKSLYQDEYIDTIAHETVHATQHCLAIRNNSSEFVPIAKFKPELWESYVSKLGVTKIEKIEEAYYDPKDPNNLHTKKLEVEAFALATKPKLVLRIYKEIC